MQGLYKVLKKKRLAFFLFFLFIIPIVSAIEECKGTITQDDSPCVVFLPNNESITPCSTITIAFHDNSSSKIYDIAMTTHTSFLCNATFNQTEIGTYSFSYSTGDSGTIIVERGTTMIFLFYFGLAFAFILLLVALWKEDQTLGSLSGILFFLMGVFMVINGFQNLSNTMTVVTASVLWAAGIFIFYKASIENF